jgi:hypothetical protein
MDRARTWAAPASRLHNRRPLVACAGRITRLDDDDYADHRAQAQQRDSASPEPRVYSRRARRPVDSDDESTLSHFEEWKAAIEANRPKVAHVTYVCVFAHTPTRACRAQPFEQRLLSQRLPGATLAPHMFSKQTELEGGANYLTCVMRTPGFWAKRFEVSG